MCLNSHWNPEELTYLISSVNVMPRSENPSQKGLRPKTEVLCCLRGFKASILRAELVLPACRVKIPLTHMENLATIRRHDSFIAVYVSSVLLWWFKDFNANKPHRWKLKSTNGKYSQVPVTSPLCIQAWFLLLFKLFKKLFLPFFFSSRNTSQSQH